MAIFFGNLGTSLIFLLDVFFEGSFQLASSSDGNVFINGHYLPALGIVNQVLKVCQLCESFQSHCRSQNYYDPRHLVSKLSGHAIDTNHPKTLANPSAYS